MKRINKNIFILVAVMTKCYAAHIFVHPRLVPRDSFDLRYRGAGLDLIVRFSCTFLFPLNFICGGNETFI